MKSEYHHFIWLSVGRSVLWFLRPHRDLSDNTQWETHKKLDSKHKHVNKHCSPCIIVYKWPFGSYKDYTIRPLQCLSKQNSELCAIKSQAKEKKKKRHKKAVTQRWRVEKAWHSSYLVHRCDFFWDNTVFKSRNSNLPKEKMRKKK